MKKSVLLKYISGSADENLQKEVLEWANRCEQNMDYLVSLKLTDIAAGMPKERASAKEIASMRKMMEIDSRQKSLLKSRNRYRIFSYISCAAAAIAAIAFILKPDTFTEQQVKESLMHEIREGRMDIGIADIPENAIQTIYTEKGIKSETTLPDGSTVKLNSDTRISYPVKFVGATREVFITGEAYFNVVSDSLKPMIVTTGKGSKIKVLGTEFNVKSYSNDAVEQTTLYSGRITMTSSSGEECKTIMPMEQVSVDAGENIKVVKSLTVEDTKAWTEGKLIFDATPISEVVKMLERWHGVQITVLDSSVLNYRITANFESESIQQIMYIIKNVSLVDYHIDGRKVSIFAR